jgi:ZipA, C-terminal FtsZ-binding domain
MSTFTMGLAIIGGLVLAGVVAHGAWNSRRNAPRVADPDTIRDTHLDPGATTLINASDTSPHMHEEIGAMTEPRFTSQLLPPVGVGLGFDSNLMPLGAAEKKPPLDALIDVLVPIALESEVSGDMVLAALPATRRVGSKPFAVEGKNTVNAQWEACVAGQRYNALQAGVQLANRTGALNDIEYSEFVVKTQSFADAVGGAPDFPDMQDEVARGRELDQFASSQDAQLSFTIRARATAWSPGYVHQNAARLGLVQGVMPGRMVLASSHPGLPPILGLSFDTQAALADDPEQSALRECRLMLDVPQVARAEQPFVRMREVAKTLASAMDGAITDDQGQIIRSDAMDAIGADLETLYDNLDAHDLSAGSVLARRLFS